MPVKTTGHGATIAFGTSGFTACYLKIGGAEMSREDLDASCLSTEDYREFQPSDLIDAGEFDIEFFFDPTASLPPITEDAEEITITLPPVATGATFVGQGYLKSLSLPELASNELMRCTAKIKWAGGFTYTPES